MLAFSSLEPRASHADSFKTLPDIIPGNFAAIFENVEELEWKILKDFSRTSAVDAIGESTFSLC